MPSYERLTAWKLSYEMALQIYNATDDFPRDERYGLTSQLRRAAFSVAANIGYIDHEQWQKLENGRNHAGALTWRLLRAMRGGR